MKKTSIKHLTISSIIIFLLAALLSFFISNYKVLRLNSDERGKNDIEISNIKYEGFSEKNNSLKSIEGVPHTITINFEKKYIDKLKFNYLVSQGTQTRIEIQGTNIYGTPERREYNGELHSKINIFSEKIKNKIENIKITFIGENIELSNISVDNEIRFDYNLFVLLGVFGIAIYSLYYKRDYFSKNIASLFLILIISIGGVILFVSPKNVGISWDDEIHFERAYQLFNIDRSRLTESVTSVTNVGENGFMHFNTLEEQKAFEKYLNGANKKNNEINKDDKLKFIPFNEIIYLPMGLILKAGEMINMPFTLTFLLGKIINFILYVVIGYLAIKKTPVFKKLLAAVLLIPTALFLSTQYSYDPLITVTLLYGIACFLKEYSEKEKPLELKNAFLIIASISFASFGKAIYAPFLLLLLALPKEKFKSKKQSIKFKIGVGIICTLLMCTFILPVLINKNVIGDLRGGDTSVSKQLLTILSSPLSFTIVLWHNMGSLFLEKLIGINGIVSFGYLGISSTTNYYFIYIMLLVFLGLTDNKKSDCIDFKLKVFLIIMDIAVILLIWTALYLSFTPVGNFVINGVQNRYFIPLLFPILLCLRTDKIKSLITDKFYMLILSGIVFITMYGFIYTNILKAWF